MKTVSLIIPLFNEEAGIEQLALKLKPVWQKLAEKYSLELVFVNDGSTDSTSVNLRAAFAKEITAGSARICEHITNLNLGAALRTGGESSRGEWLLYLDSDCTYEPEVLFDLIAALERGADLATASPYHPLGRVDGVPAWRLLLSKGLSRIYQRITRAPIHTYTAMVRAIKRPTYMRIRSDRNDFTAVAEMMIKAILLEAKIVEVPTVLKTRRYGVSKLKTLRVIRSHLQIIWQLLFNRRNHFLKRA